MKSSQSTRIKLIGKLKRHFGVANGTNTALANRLGANSQKRKSWNAKFSGWKTNPEPLSNTEILNLIKDIREADAKEHKEKIKEEQEKIRAEFINTIVEYFPIKKVESKGRKNYEISSPNVDNDMKQKWDDFREKLENTKSGIYIFYDSSGRAIYVGKTSAKSSLWARMKSSFNHGPQKSRRLYRIDHSPNAKPLDQKLGSKPVQLHELARYFSAYEVDKHFTHSIEALLIRAFADNLMNKKMENFLKSRDKV